MSKKHEKRLIRNIYCLKQELYNDTTHDSITKIQWRKTIFAPRIFFCGLTAFPMIAFFVGKPLGETVDSFVFLLFDSVLLLGILSGVYALLYFCMVKNYRSSMYGKTVLFHIFFGTISIMLLAIVVYAHILY